MEPPARKFELGPNGEWPSHDMDFSEMVKHIWALCAFVEIHGIEVRGDETAAGDPGMMIWDDEKQETRISLRWTVPYELVCEACGELVPRPEHHYGSQGNGRHQWAKFVDGELVPFVLKEGKQ
jgi:hypothetical protein